MKKFKLDRPPKLRKFYVELKNPRNDATDQSKAIAAANKAGGAALRIDFNMKMGEAKLVQIDPSELNASKAIIVDDDRVWVLENWSVRSRKQRSVLGFGYLLKSEERTVMPIVVHVGKEALAKAARSLPEIWADDNASEQPFLDAIARVVEECALSRTFGRSPAF